MAATVTYNFKDKLIDLILTDVDTADTRYYVGLGRSQDWTDSDGSGSLVPDAATDSLRSTRLVRENLQSVKSIVDYEFTAPRYNWSTGTTYTAYDDSTVGNSNAYYVVTQSNAVYICLQQGRDVAGNSVASTVQPTGALTSPFKTADGYVWKFLYTISAGAANRYLSANFIPVPYVESTDSSSTALELEQKGVQDAASAGQVVGYAVTEGGSGYTSAPTVTIVGDGSGAKAKAFVSAGSVTKIEVMDSDGAGNPGYQFGSNYNRAKIVFSGGAGTGATARAIFSVPNGVGANAREDLRAKSIMFNTKPDGTEGGDFVTGNDFRQVSILRNPTIYDSDGLFADATGDALRKIRVDITTITGTISADKVITQSSTGASAYVDKFDSDTIWYHQTEETGFYNFAPNQQISYDGGTATLEDDSATALLDPEIDIYSGELLYFDNRAAVLRDDAQTEDIKIVIQF